MLVKSQSLSHAKRHQRIRTTTIAVVLILFHAANMRLRRLVFSCWIAAGLTLASNAWPDELKSPSVNVASKKDDLISASLRKGVDGFSIKLADLIQSTDSTDEPRLLCTGSDAWPVAKGLMEISAVCADGVAGGKR